MAFKKIGALVALVVLTACSSTGSTMFPRSGNDHLSSLSSSNWQSLDSKTIQPPAGDLAAFAFAEQTHSRLLVTANDPSKNPLLGNHAGQTIIATATVTGLTGVFTYTGEPSCGSTTSSVRLYFTSTGGPFAFTDFWWSDVAPGSATLDSNNTLTLSAILDPTTPWSDWNGQPSSGLPTEFTAAASDIRSIGLSFGGGCFFENGVGTSDSSGVFTLQTFTVQ